VSNDGGVPGIYTLDGGDPVILEGAMFIPTLTGVSPLERPVGAGTIFTFTGLRFYPCGMKVNIYQSRVDNFLQVLHTFCDRVLRSYFFFFCFFQKKSYLISMFFFRTLI
jgi:hypothetical protein